MKNRLDETAQQYPFGPLTVPEQNGVRPRKSKPRHGPNIAVSLERFKKPRTFQHARLAVEQGLADVLAIRLSLRGSVCARTNEMILASLDIQLGDIRRYLDGE